MYVIIAAGSHYSSFPQLHYTGYTSNLQLILKFTDTAFRPFLPSPALSCDWLNLLTTSLIISIRCHLSSRPMTHSCMC